MAKTAAAPTAAATPAPAPLFALARAVLDEQERQLAQWADHGHAQLGEAFRLGRAVQAQMTAATREMLTAFERLSADMMSAGMAWTRTASRVA